MALLVESPELSAIEEFLLCDEDFPKNYINFAHPEDYQIQGHAITREHIHTHRHSGHNRLIWRISWQVANDKYVPMSFVLDTGAPKQMYLCQAAMERLEEFGAIKWDDDLGVQYVQLFGHKVGVERTPKSHDPANIIGLRLLMRLGLSLQATAPYFTFDPERHVLTSEEEQQMQRHTGS